MQRLSQLIRIPGAAWLVIWGFALTANAQTACTRENLKDSIQKYFAALEAHDPSGLPLAANVKYTENGVELALGKGFWQTAGKALLKRDLIDTLKCGTHTQAVIEEKYVALKAAAPAPKAAFPGMQQPKLPPHGTLRPILYCARLKVENGKISEIETIIARETEFAFNAAGVLATKDQDWGTLLPPEERSSRLAMIAAADDYFDMFAKVPKVRTPFAQVCDRWENGFQTTIKLPGSPAPADMREHDCSPKGLEILNHGPRRFLVDLEAGIVVAYVHFAGGLPDAHMFKMRNGQVYLIQAVVGAGSKSMGWPIEPVCKQ